ncbi:chloride channel protein [Lutibacter sp. A80]|uniref:chloride channel protein n=1 Tax=Lutibacter sp. A80 TaxID=2918453 RepID=UPI001F0681E3|nr:chloride channel protein [Lutibacter sp. A80]UMB59593.1 chloride channel protein [Lutibacter sp. A80]
MSEGFKKVLKKFLIWRFQHISDKQFINISSAVIGLLAGVSAVVLKNSTHFIQERLEDGIIKDIHHAFYFIFPLIGLIVVYIIKKYFIRKKLGHGIPVILFSISKLKGVIPRYQMWASLITAPFTVGFGGSAGLEGPIVATGAAMGSNFARLMHLNQSTKTLLIGAAVAGVFSSIFQAPIAAIVFTVEVFSLELTMVSMIPILLASITAVLTSYFFFGDDILLHFEVIDKFQLEDVIFYVLLGVFSAMASIYFSKIYFRIGGFFRDFKGFHKRLLFGGTLLGVMVYLVPPLFGEGYSTINNILRGDIYKVVSNNIFHIQADNVLIIILFLLGLILFKVVATSLTFGAGGVGGVFAPTLFTGSVTGYVFALIINNSNIFSHQLSSANFAMVGMAGLMAGILQAPLTAIFLIAEITGGYQLFVPLMIVSAISYLITKQYIPHNIYSAELAKKGQLITHDKDKKVLLLMDVDKVIETNFIIIHPNMNLGDIVNKAVIKSTRNHFPVVNDANEFLGILMLDDIRSIMFEQKLYTKLKAKNLMQMAPAIINYDKDSMEVIMDKFKDTVAWNLPVLKDGKYYGFISKSRLLTAYRRKLINVTA